MSSEIEEIPQFNPLDLPQVEILSDLDSSDISSHPSTPTPPGTPDTLVTPGTPAAPMSELALSGPRLTFSEKETTPFAQPSSKRAYRRKIRSGFRKGNQAAKRRLFTPATSSSNKISLSHPKAGLLKQTKFPQKPVCHDILIKRGEDLKTRSMFVPHGTEIMNMDVLCHVISLLRCNEAECWGSMQLHKLPRSEGLQSHFILHCIRCHTVVAEFASSLCVGESPKEAINNPMAYMRRPAEVNTRATFAVHCTSLSWRDFRLLCALMDLPVPNKDLNKRALESVKACATQVSQESMSLAALDVRSRENAVPSKVPGAMNCDVSFDASWHRRGHYSNQGFAAAIDAVTNKVLDYVLYQRVCRKCSRWSAEMRSSQPDDYSTFWAEHQLECAANFTGSSQSMEGAGALELWKRSVAKNNLVYSTYIGDGDSSSFKNLLQADPYKGIEIVRKEECLGHVQKRLKQHLKTKSNAFPKISALKVERVGQLYALVVVQNRGKTPLEIHTALLNLLQHFVEDHENCPCSLDSWCYFQKRRAENNQDSSVSLPHLRQSYLTGPEYERAKEVFNSFASMSMCGALTMGKTQNANESLHSIVWHNSPKGRHIGHKSIDASTALAVVTFNDGDIALSAVLSALAIPASHSTLLLLSRRDRDRNTNRDRANLETQKRRRRQLAVCHITAESSRKRRKNLSVASTYKSAKFGTEAMAIDSGKESDTTCEVCDLRVCPIGRRRKTADWLGCDLCGKWFHCMCVGVSHKSLGDSAYFCVACS